jgi:hypothetical protein
VINVGGNSVAEKKLETADVHKTLVPNHDSFLREEKSELPLIERGWGRNLGGRAIVKIIEFFVNEILGSHCYLLSLIDR